MLKNLNTYFTSHLITSYKLHETILMGLFTLFCFALTLFRVHYTGSKFFLFLNWNLFLAFVPWLVTTLVIITPRLQQSKFVVVATLGLWLLFFPNAPYILTDLLHLKLNPLVPIWYDLMLILSFAWAGLMYGFFSLLDIERLLQNFIKPMYIPIISIILLFISSFGIYLGRFLRWNSWDIIADPMKLFNDILDRIINPFAHTTTWGVTLLMGIFLTMVYLCIKLIRVRK